MSTGPAHRVTSAVEVYGYPQGHLGRLSDEEEAALKAFKKLCTDTGLYKGPKDDEFGTNDDATLLFVQPLYMLTTAANNGCLGVSSEPAASTSLMPSNSLKIHRSGARQINLIPCTKLLIYNSMMRRGDL